MVIILCIFFSLIYFFVVYNTEMQTDNNSNEIDLIKDAISENHIKYYNYEDFYNSEKIGSGGFATIYRVKRKNSMRYFALKSFYPDYSIKEIINEVIYAF